MRRLTARLLLLAALVGTFIPLALAAASAPPHACCLRKTAHRCHGYAVAPAEHLSIAAIDCCSRDGRRAVTTSQWASPEPSATAFSTHACQSFDAEANSTPTAADFQGLVPARAPPLLSLFDS